MVINRQMDQETGAHPHRVRQAGNKREGAINNTHNSMGEPQNNDTEFLKSQTEKSDTL